MRDKSVETLLYNDPFLHSGHIYPLLLRNPTLPRPPPPPKKYIEKKYRVKSEIFGLMSCIVSSRQRRTFLMTMCMS